MKKRAKEGGLNRAMETVQRMIDGRLQPDPVEEGFNKAIADVCHGIMKDVLASDEKARTKLQAECLRWISEEIHGEGSSIADERPGPPLFVFDWANKDITSAGRDPVAAAKMAQDIAKRTGHVIVVLRQVASYGRPS